MTQGNETTVVLNTAKTININSLFQLLKIKSKYKITDVNKHHLIFIIHQINFFTIKYGYCDFDSKGYYNTLGCTPNIVATILNLLDDKGLIKRTRRGNNVNEKVSSYVFISPFNYKNLEECDEHRYLTNYKNTPKFINVWVINKFKIIRKPEKIKQDKPEPKQPKVKSLRKLEQIHLIFDLQDEIKRLQALLQSNGISYSDDVNSSLESLKIEDNVKVDSSIIEEDVIMCEAHINNEVKIFEYENEKYLVENWKHICENIIFDEEYLFEEIADAYTNKNFSISDMILNKKYDINEEHYYVQLVG